MAEGRKEERKKRKSGDGGRKPLGKEPSAVPVGKETPGREETLGSVGWGRNPGREETLGSAEG